MGEHGAGGATSPPSVLAFVLPGIGHYLPIASLLLELDPPGGATIAAELPADSALAQKVIEDGFRYVQITSIAPAGASAAALRSLARLLRSRLAPRLAARGRQPIGLPALPARLAVAVGTQILPIAHPSAAAGAALGAILDRVGPHLLLHEYDSPWFGVLAAERGLPHVRYATSPVGAIQPGRPIPPTGLDPRLPGVERPVNACIFALRSLRRWRADAVWRTARRRHAANHGAFKEAEPIASVSFSARSLDDYPTRPQHAYAYVGASLYRPHGEVAPGPHRDSVLVSWGSRAASSDAAVMARLLPALVDLATEVRVVVVSGDPGVRERVLAASSAIVLLDRTPAPPYDEYRRARLVLGHGGYGTIIESLCFGVPVLTIPLMVADRLETSQRLLQAGAGLTLDRYTFDATDAADAIARLLEEPAFAVRAEALGAELRERSARAELLDLLRSTLAGERPA